MDGDRAEIGRLVMCPTPIGNLRDLTLRALDVLRDADAIACEDTRHTGLLLERHGISRQGTSLISLHEHNERERVAELVGRIESGQTVVLVSDAGTPLISDPGYLLVKAAIDAGLRVEALPGPSAILVALVASGLPSSSFRFAGFLPKGRGELAKLLAHPSETLIAFESPRRLPGTLSLLAELDPERPVAVCRELTKLHEEVARGSAAELAKRFAEAPPRGEVVLVVGAAPEQAGDVEAALQAVSDLLDAGAKPRVAARTVARLTGVAANELYEIAAGGGRSKDGSGDG